MNSNLICNNSKTEVSTNSRGNNISSVSSFQLIAVRPCSASKWWERLKDYSEAFTEVIVHLIDLS